MAAATVSAAAIKNTQNSLGKYVTKPPLTDKLLRKPPFRFLHDILSAVIRDTGSLGGLYTDLEMDSENVKDREAKVQYLEKAIACVGFALGEGLAVKPGKVVAGQEPERTNEFLQALARMLDAGVDTGPAVERVLGGEKPKAANSPAKRPAAAPAGDKKKGKENNVPASAIKGKTTVKAAPTASSSRRGSVETAGNRSRSQSRSRESTAAPPATTNGGRASRESTANSVRNNGAARSRSRGRSSSITDVNGETMDSMENGNNESNNNNGGVDSGLGTLEEESGERSRPTTTSGRRRSSVKIVDELERPSLPPDEGLGNENESQMFETLDGEGANQELTQQTNSTATVVPMRPGSALRSARPRTGRLKSGRPPSARPAAPRLKERAEMMAAEELQARPKTGKVMNVIVAGDDKDDDDGEEFLVEEKPKDTLDLLAEAPTQQTDTLAIETGGLEHGALVQQILETQKELEEVSSQKKKTGIEIEREGGGLTDAGRRRDRESTQKEVDKLRASIQTLTRSANPLGKLMDFLQEDVDAMQRELDTWRKENHGLQQELRQEQATTEESVEPLRAVLAELEAAVQEQLDKISVVKSNILRNDEKISRMMSSIGTAAR